MKNISKKNLSILKTNKLSHLVQPWPYAGSIGNEPREILNQGDGI